MGCGLSDAVETPPPPPPPPPGPPGGGGMELQRSAQPKGKEDLERSKDPRGRGRVAVSEFKDP